MSAANCLLTEDQFLCSICLDVFTDPVSIPCGHNFCKSCITEHWETSTKCQCPNCSKVFKKRPEFKVNTFISEMVAQFRQSAQQETSSSSEQQVSKPGEVSCDIGPGHQTEGSKVLPGRSGFFLLFLTCLVCLVSCFFELHLKMPGLENRMCEKHNKPLELFCKDDLTLICVLCSVKDHKTHDVVPLKEGYEGKKVELKKTEADIQQMIQKRRLKIEEIKQSVELSDKNADRETAEGVQVFTVLENRVHRSQNQFIHLVKMKQRETQKQAEGFIKELQQEISDLEKRSSEVEQLSRCEDHLHLLQNFRSLNPAPPTKDWTRVRVHPPSYEAIVVRAVEQGSLRKQMEELFETELKRVQQFEVDLTLDPDTAHLHLILSDDGKQVYHSDVKKNFPCNPKRFVAPCVLAKQSFSSGRFYFEVQVKGKTEWILGVAKESINRKGEITLSPQDGYWTILLRNENEYKALAGPSVRLSLQSVPKKVGVFVDYEEGLVSFYDVDAAALIYSFTGCSFTEKLLPFISPNLNNGDKNSAPLIISAVHQILFLFYLYSD